MKRLLTFLLLLLALSCGAVTFPLTNGVIQGALNGNGGSITNLGSITASNYVGVSDATGVTNKLAGAAATQVTNLVNGAVSNSLSGALTLTNSANVLAGLFSGSGAGISNINRFPALTKQTVIVFDGDSLTSGTAGIGTPLAPGMTWARWLTNVFLTNTSQFIILTNAAVAGETVQTMNSNYTAFIHPFAPGAGTNGILFFWGGQNDWIGSVPGVITNLAGYYAKAKADGWTLVVLDITDNTIAYANPGQESQRDWFNQYIRTNTISDYVVSPASMFTSLSNNGVPVTIDGVHFTTNCQYQIAKQVFKTIQSLPQSQDIKIGNDIVGGPLKSYAYLSPAGGTDETYRGVNLGAFFVGYKPYLTLDDAGNGATSIGVSGGLLNWYNQIGTANFNSTWLMMTANGTISTWYGPMTLENSLTVTNQVTFYYTNGAAAYQATASGNWGIGAMLSPGYQILGTSNMVNFPAPVLLTNNANTLAGNGISITNLSATNLAGTIQTAQFPPVLPVLDGHNLTNLTATGGTVTSISISTPPWEGVSPGTITSSGTFSISGAATSSDGLFVASPASGSGVFSARLIVPSDLNNAGGPFAATNGNSGQDFAAHNLNATGNVTVGGTLNGNGGGLTNLNLVPKIVSTNFISGLIYTNSYGYPIQVSTSAYVSAATPNIAYMGLVIGSTTTNFVSATGTSATATTLSAVLSGFVPAGSTYVFTNLTSGTGTATINYLSNPGQILVY